MTVLVSIVVYWLVSIPVAMVVGRLLHDDGQSAPEEWEGGTWPGNSRN